MSVFFNLPIIHFEITLLIINRTNNPLERYNSTLNEMLPAHPTMTVFVEEIHGEKRRYVDLLQDIFLQILFKLKQTSC